MIHVLERVAAERGLPTSIVCDNGPEFAGKALDRWAFEHGVTLQFIRPGEPIENAYCESFNGKLRDECRTRTGLRVSPMRSARSSSGSPSESQANPCQSSS